MRRAIPALALFSLVALLFLVVGTPSSRAEDESPGDRSLVSRFFKVGALTSPRPRFFSGSMDVSDTSWDSEVPLFGSEGEEPDYPVGTIDELTELLRGFVRPALWDTMEGAEIRIIDETTILVTCPPDVVRELALFLQRLERDLLTTLTVEVRAIDAPRQAVEAALVEGSRLLLDDARLAELLTEASVSEVALRVFNRSRACVEDGAQQAYLSDYDVEVATKSFISDPIVSVLQSGFSCEVRPTLDRGGRSALLDLKTIHAVDRGFRSVDVGEDRSVEAPRVDISSLHAILRVPLDRWCLLDGASQDGGAGRRVFAVRARAHPFEGAMGPTMRGELDLPVAAGAGRLETRILEIGSLVTSVPARQGRGIYLVPSLYTPLEPAELPEPLEILGGDALVELVRENLAPDSWSGRRGFIEARSGRLIARNTPDVLDALEGLLDALQREFMWAVAIRAEILRVDEATAAMLLAPGGNGLLDPERSDRLQAAMESGAAERQESARLTSMRGVRNVVRQGRELSYHQDYAVEIAEDSRTANPIVQTVLSGVELDVAAALSSGGDAVKMDVQFTQGRIDDEIRTVETPGGTLECPRLDIFRLRSSLVVPVGRSAIVGLGGRGGRVLLLTPEDVRLAR